MSPFFDEDPAGSWLPHPMRWAEAAGPNLRYQWEIRDFHAPTMPATGAMCPADGLYAYRFRVSADGATVTQWVTDASLTGVTGANPCGPGAGFPIGANGIVVDAAGSNVYVTNTDRATVLRIPIGAGGAAGAPAVIVAQDCARLAGADGLTRGPDGALYVAANAANAITRVSLDGAQVSALERGGVLESPASIAFGARMSAPTMFITNAAFTTAQTPGATAHPGLLVRPAM